MTGTRLIPVTPESSLFSLQDLTRFWSLSKTEDCGSHTLVLTACRVLGVAGSLASVSNDHIRQAWFIFFLTDSKKNEQPRSKITQPLRGGRRQKRAFSHSDRAGFSTLVLLTS